MAEKKKSKYVRLTSPKGVARHPWLTKPDTKFNEEGDYKVNLVVSKKDAEPLIKSITSIRDKYAVATKAKKKADLPWVDEVDDNGKKTGKVVFKFKVAAKTGDWDRKPKLFDAKGNRVTDVSIGSGTTMKVSFDIFTWPGGKDGCGVTLQPVAVQIIDLVEYQGSGGSAEDFGFEEEEGSFESESDGMEDEVEADSSSEDDDVF